MASIADLRRQIDVLDRQIIELLGRRTTLVKQVLTHLGEEEQIDKDREQQVLSNWLEEGFDHDLDEVTMEKVCKAIMDLGRRSKDR